MRHRVAAHKPPDALALLGAEERELLTVWVRKDNASRSREALLKDAGTHHIERAEALSDWLLREGWVERKEHLKGGTWQWEGMTWRDLDRLKSLLGVGSRNLRVEARSLRFKQAWAWLEGIAPPGNLQLREVVGQAIQQLEAEPTQRVNVVGARLDLLECVVTWQGKQMNGTRRDFALFAGEHTKSISAGDWKWLERFLDLESLGITHFVPMIWLAGDIQLAWGARVVDLSPLHCLALSQEDLLKTTVIRGNPEYWWLIENRASFERQASKRPTGAFMAWLPGRPSQDWLKAVTHLLGLALRPLKVSADADPSGIDIARTVGRVWKSQGQSWVPHQMGLEEWNATTQKWPLNEHDVALLHRLLGDDALPEQMKELCTAMMREGRKAEQEGWL